jgi:hypothetical protein
MRVIVNRYSVIPKEDGHLIRVRKEVTSTLKIPRDSYFFTKEKPVPYSAFYGDSKRTFIVNIPHNQVTYLWDAKAEKEFSVPTPRIKEAWSRIPDFDRFSDRSEMVLREEENKRQREDRTWFKKLITEDRYQAKLMKVKILGNLIEEKPADRSTKLKKFDVSLEKNKIRKKIRAKKARIKKARELAPDVIRVVNNA